MNSRYLRRMLPATLLWAACGVSLALVGPARAQDATGGGEDGAAPAEVAPVAASLLQVDGKQLSTLAASLKGRVGAVSLRATQAELENNAVAREALSQWVQSGGVVFLHTDAAAIFGYSTVEARQGANRLAGQLYGRARAALPFGAHPLLCDGGDRTTGSLANVAVPGKDLTRLPGVNVVYYEMQQGDQLVRAHAGAAPLLQVTDLATNDGVPLYAAAIAPYGRGWAVFTPDYIDQRRADGGLFVRNLLTLMPDARGARNWVGVRASSIDAAATAGDLTNLLVDLAGGGSPALPALGTAPAPPPLLSVLTATRILLSSADAAAISAVLRGTEVSRKAALVKILGARLEWQRGDAAKAAAFVEGAAALAPDAAEVSFLRGNIIASAAQEVAQPSPQRGQILANAVAQWDAATVAPALARSITTAPVSATAPAGTPAPQPVLAVGGVAVSALRDWSARAKRAANMFAAEPPMVQKVGTGTAAITIRYYEEDTSLRVAGPAIQALADSRFFGWRADNEEVLLFPTPEYYAAYRRAAGLTGRFVPLPAAALGDVSGARILMVAVPSFPRVFRDALGRIRFAPGEASGANVLARLHSYTLLNALAEGGSRPPAWMQLGLEELGAATIAGTNQIAPARATLYALAQGNALMTPAQYASGRANAATPGLAEAQAVALMDYFYRAFGAGAVTETLQRLGSGQTADAALTATTELNQLEFFGSWRDAELGG